MKTLLLAAVALIAISVPAHAGTLPDDVSRWYALNEICRSAGTSDEIDKACDLTRRLSKDLVARGYCIYGHGVIGRYSKNKRHCYERRNLWPKK
jgi:hypothetical protein